MEELESQAQVAEAQKKVGKPEKVKPSQGFRVLGWKPEKYSPV